MLVLNCADGLYVSSQKESPGSTWPNGTGATGYMKPPSLIGPFSDGSLNLK